MIASVGPSEAPQGHDQVLLSPSLRCFQADSLSMAQSPSADCSIVHLGSGPSPPWPPSLQSQHFHGTPGPSMQSWDHMHDQKWRCSSVTVETPGPPSPARSGPTGARFGPLIHHGLTELSSGAQFLCLFFESCSICSN